MKIKGENEEQVAQATQIRDTNLEILAQLKTFIEEDKVWPANNEDDDAAKETKARYKRQALAGVDLIAAELKSSDAAFYLAYGAEEPMVHARLLRSAVAGAKPKEKEEIEHAVEKLETSLQKFYQSGGGGFTYKTMIPKYEFKFIR